MFGLQKANIVHIRFKLMCKPKMGPLPVNFVIETILILYYQRKSHHLSTTVKSVSQNKNPKSLVIPESQKKTTQDLRDLCVEYRLWTGSDGFQIITAKRLPSLTSTDSLDKPLWH